MLSALAMHEAFLADIRSAPDDDTPRLIYADWLEENGSDDAERARGQFIRLQCRAFSVAYHFSWTDAKLQNEGMRLLAECPHLTSCRELEIEKPGCDNDGLGHLARSKTLATVETLTLEGSTYGGPTSTRLSAGGIVTLLESAAMPRLRSLGLCGGMWGSGYNALTQLYACAALARIKSLNLSSNYFTDTAARELAGCKHLRNLRSLDLGIHELTDAGVLALLGSPHLANLEYLSLYDGVIKSFGPVTMGRLRERFAEGNHGAWRRR